MKIHYLKFSLFLALAAFSCKDMPKTVETIPEVEVIPNIEDDATNALNSLPEKKCYLYAVDNDSITLNITTTADKVEGDMRYNFYQIDGSFGTFEGFIKGDTLRGFYDFEAEGYKSKRELIFLKKNGILVLGKGETELRGNIELFKNNPAFTFEKGHLLRSVVCKSGTL